MKEMNTEQAAWRSVRIVVTLCMLVLGTGASGVALADTVAFQTPGAVTWTVPRHVYSVKVVATGGGGGYGNGGNGGNGGVVTATLPVQPGQTLQLFVGGGGSRNPLGLSSGGGGSSNVDAGTAHQIIAGGGGGASTTSGGDGNGHAGPPNYGVSIGGAGGAYGIGGAGGAGGGGLAGQDGNGGPGGEGGTCPWGGGTGGAGSGGGGGGGVLSNIYCMGGGGGGGYGGGGGGGEGGGGWRGGGGGGGSTGPAGAVYTVASNGGIYNPNGGTPSGNGSIVLTYNAEPAFVSAGAGTLTVAQNASATDIAGLLRVDDSDTGQTLTWTRVMAPSHGTLNVLNASASSGAADITPGGTLTYTPATGYSGGDTFTVQVSDGITTATRVINVTVEPLISSRNPASVPFGITFLNMAGGSGPSITSGMVAVLSDTQGVALRYVGQSASGAVVLAGFDGANVAFVPISYQNDDARPNGLYPVGNGQYQVVVNGTAVTVAPTIQNLDQLMGLLPLDVQARMDASGVLSVRIGETTYVVRPSVVVQLLNNPSGKPSLSMGSDGYWHFIDAQGNSQILYPAFADVTALRNALLGLDGSATLSIQLDGTAASVFKGQRYTLVPDITLSGVPAERLGQSMWQDGAGQDGKARYRVVNNHPLGTTQGLTVKP